MKALVLLILLAACSPAVDRSTNAMSGPVPTEEETRAILGLNEAAPAQSAAPITTERAEPPPSFTPPTGEALRRQQELIRDDEQRAVERRTRRLEVERMNDQLNRDR